ncbi:hypothetical protein DWB84_00710 [Saccharophagus sp. K07]|jgi:chorismate mutase|uniref:hypothetical protein n=1 Tax=Saccharophagus sp. K07 TaxID=2283636 RepID=UPI0016521247|nr:hypothetical protein [Saccharophagus sp. K07]MBC6903995.1 hypothetical protein [Saccharophagus sp. K07]
MYCTETCADLVLCKKKGAVDTSSDQKTAIQKALQELSETLKSTNESLANCFVFTLESRNRLMDKIAEVKECANKHDCGYLQELSSLAEIVIMLLFRSNHYRDHQGLARIEDAVQQMQLCFVTNDSDEGHRKRVTETIENLWQWVDMNTVTGIRHF